MIDIDFELHEDREEAAELAHAERCRCLDCDDVSVPFARQTMLPLASEVTRG